MIPPRQSLDSARGGPARAESSNHGTGGDRPWAAPGIGAYGEPRADDVVTLEDALKRIETSGVEFLYDYDPEVAAAYVLAAVDTSDVVGPRLATSIYMLLTDAGIRVLRHGARPGRARNGRAYSYFFRVENMSGGLPPRSLVKSALRRERRQTNTDAPNAQRDSLRSTGFENADAELRHALQRAADAERRALGALHIQDRRITAHRRRVEDSLDSLRQVMAQVATSRTVRRDDASEPGRLRILELKLEGEIESALTFASEQEGRANELADRLAWFETEYGRLVGRIETLESESSTEADSVSEQRNEWIDRLLPEVQFLGDSVSVLWHETDRIGWLRDIMLLVHNHSVFVEEMQKRGKIERVHRNPDYSEVRRTRSANDMSRLYFTDKLTAARASRCNAGKRWLLLLDIKSDKKQQNRAMASLP